MQANLIAFSRAPAEGAALASHRNEERLHESAIEVWTNDGMDGLRGMVVAAAGASS
jgi:hypothetical protein